MFLGFVESVIGRSDQARDVIDHQFRILIGDGQDTCFWNDDWTKRGQLRLCFQRIIALARSKAGLVRDFRRWREGRWRREIDQRRRVFY